MSKNCIPVLNKQGKKQELKRTKINNIKKIVSYSIGRMDVERLLANFI